MIGIVVVSHGNLSSELCVAARHVVGEQDKLMSVCIEPDADIDEKNEAIRAAVAQCDDGEGVIILTDMFGGTPSNLALKAMKSGKVEVIAGANLPMLIKLIELRSKVPLDEAAKMTVDAGRKYINLASEILKR